MLATPLAPATETILVSASDIAQFKAGVSDNRFGRLEYLGGLEFSSRNPLVQSLSAIRFRPDGKSFVSVLDTGHWLTGRIERDAQGRLARIADVKVDPILLRGNRRASKVQADSEGLALRPGQAIVSFEGAHRVDIFPDPGFETSGPVRTLDYLIPRHELRMNAGFETLAVSPVASPLKGSLVAVTERSLDDEGRLFAAILEGPLKGIFKVVRHDPYDVTDGAFLPNGDLLLLERRFSLLGGLGMRLRLIKGNTIRPGAVVDGEILLEAGMGSHAVDNMEGLDVIVGPDGKPHIILVSDDNGNLLQRNIMLEFRLND